MPGKTHYGVLAQVFGGLVTRVSPHIWVEWDSADKAESLFQCSVCRSTLAYRKSEINRLQINYMPSSTACSGARNAPARQLTEK